MNRQSQGTTGIETLEEILELLRITKEYASDRNKTTKPATSEDISTAPAVYNKIAQAIMPKSIISDLEWFDGDQTKFKDQWRGI